MSILKHIRSSTANKRPTASGLADGQLAINTASGTPGVFFKDSASGIVKIGPPHVGAAAPNASPAGSAGNSLGEIWINNSTTIQGLNYYNGSSFVNLTPSGTTSVAGLVELATPAETQAGTDGVRAVTPSGLQSKVSDSISTASSTTIASATAVKTAYDLANAALARTGGTVTGEIVISPSGSISFEGSSDDGFETTLAVVNPTADRIITFPDITGTVITNADTGTVTSAMIANGTIVDEDISASASIALSKLATGALPSGITVDSSNISNLSITNDDISASAGIVDSKLATISGADKVSISALNIDGSTDIGAALADEDLIIVDDGGTGTNRKAALTRVPVYTFSKISGEITVNASGVAAISNGVIVNADVSASAAIAGTKISPDFGGQTIVSSGIFSHPLGTSGAPSITFTGDLNTGIYSPGADTLAASTAGSERLRITSAGLVGVGTTSPSRKIHVEDGITTGTFNLARYSSFNGASSKFLDITIDNTEAAPVVNLDAGKGGGSNPSLAFLIGTSERARIDSSGRLLVGTSSSITGGQLQVGANSGTVQANIQAIGSSNSANYWMVRSNNGGIVSSGDRIGGLLFRAHDSNTYREAASIVSEVDGTPGANDMPGRIVLSTTLDGASSPTEQWRLTNDGVQAFRQAAPAAVNATATLTVAQLKGRLITSTTAAAVTMTLPTGTDTEAGFSGVYTDMAFEWYVINTGATNDVTVQGGTGHTLVGSGTVAASTSGHFMSRRTAANTFVTYRLG